MRVGIAWGRQELELEVPEHNLIRAEATAQPFPLSDPVETIRQALQNPHNYPALRRALTPEDHIAVLVDERVPQLSSLLIAILEHVRQAGIQPEAITLLCTPPSSGQAWLDDLPDEFQDVRIEVHQPGDRRKLAYLATTKQGRRIYLNRTAVDADQLVLLTRRGYDPVVGYSGAETAVFPGLGDEATLQEYGTRLDARAPDSRPWPVQAEAKEVAWLLGVPFFVQVIEGPGDAIDQIIAGPLESSAEGERRLNARWRVAVDRPADVVIASITGAPAPQTIDDIARGFFSAARVVRPGGSIVLLTDITPAVRGGFEIFRQHEDPGQALRMLWQERPSDLASGFMWATAAEHAKLYLLSGLSSDVAEELFTIPLQNAHQAQKLLTENATCVILPDAHKTLAVVG